MVVITKNLKDVDDKCSKNYFKEEVRDKLSKRKIILFVEIIRTCIENELKKLLLLDVSLLMSVSISSNNEEVLFVIHSIIGVF